MSIELEIITPEKVILSTNAKDVNITTKAGKIGLLSGHIPIITELELGVLKLVDENREVSYAIKGGHAQKIGDSVSVLTEEAIKSSDIDEVLVNKKLASLEKDLEDAQVNKKAKNRLISSIRFYQLQLSLLKKR